MRRIGNARRAEWLPSELQDEREKDKPKLEGGGLSKTKQIQSEKGWTNGSTWKQIRVHDLKGK